VRHTTDITVTKVTTLELGGRKVKVRASVTVDALDKRPATRRYRKLESVMVLDEDHALRGLNVLPLLMPRDRALVERRSTPDRGRKRR